jgi:hypothetical protein
VTTCIEQNHAVAIPQETRLRPKISGAARKAVRQHDCRIPRAVFFDVKFDRSRQ